MLNPLLLNPFQPSSIARISQEMGQLFEAAAAQPDEVPARWPAVNAWREGDNILVEAEVPGFARHEVEILATSDSLTLRGERRSQAPAGGTPLHIEQQVTRFERSLGLGAPVDSDEIKAELINGVLRVILPIARAARARRVEIASSSGESQTALTSGTAKADQNAR